jgi:hypothetical protein
MVQNNEILRYSAAKALKLAWGILKIHKNSSHSLSVPYSGRKIKGTLQSEIALTCLWGHVAHGSVPRGKPHIQDVPQQLRDGVQCDHHNHTASCPSQTGGACKETSGLYILLVIFVPKCSPLFLYNHFSLQFFHQIIMQFVF